MSQRKKQKPPRLPIVRLLRRFHESRHGRGILVIRYMGESVTGLIIPVEFEVNIDESVGEVSDETVGDIQQEARVIIEEAGQEVVDVAHSLCPVKTGFLSSQIFYQVEDVTGLFVGDRAPYAAYVEYGTARISAQPYLRPAIDEVQPRLQEELDNMIADHLPEDTDEENPELEFDVESGFQ